MRRPLPPESDVLLLAGHGESTNIVFWALSDRFGEITVIREAGIPRGIELRARCRRYGVRRAAGQVLFRALVALVVRRRSEGRIEAICSGAGLRRADIPPSRVLDVVSANSAAVVDELSRRRPRVVVVNGTRILSKQVLRSVPATFLNMHAGITPAYRGVHGGYWALVNGDRDRCGVTVHEVDEGIDTGRILAQARIEPSAEDTFATYPFLQLAAGLPLLLDAVEDARAERLKGQAGPSGDSRLYSHPTLYEYLSNLSKAR